MSRDGRPRCCRRAQPICCTVWACGIDSPPAATGHPTEPTSRGARAISTRAIGCSTAMEPAGTSIALASVRCWWQRPWMRARASWLTRVVDVARRRDRWQVTLSGHGGPSIESCDWLVDATGRGAMVARMLGQRWTDTDNAIALLARLSPAACVDDALLVESGERGWWYSAALPDRELLAVHITDADAAHGPVCERWHGSLAASHHTRERARGRALISLQVCRASTGSLSLAAGDRWVAVGDAVLAHDPLSGQGLLYAIASGIRGAAALQQDATNEYADRALCIAIRISGVEPISIAARDAGPCRSSGIGGKISPIDSGIRLRRKICRRRMSSGGPYCFTARPSQSMANSLQP